MGPSPPRPSRRPAFEGASALEERTGLQSSRPDPFTPHSIEFALRYGCKRAGLRPISSHVLRHTFCSHLAMRGGAQPKAIQELAGHSTLQRRIWVEPKGIEPWKGWRVVGNCRELPGVNPRGPRRCSTLTLRVQEAERLRSETQRPRAMPSRPLWRARLKGPHVRDAGTLSPSWRGSCKPEGRRARRTSSLSRAATKEASDAPRANSETPRGFSRCTVPASSDSERRPWDSSSMSVCHRRHPNRCRRCWLRAWFCRERAATSRHRQAETRPARR
jgi:hypothetical protein